MIDCTFVRGALVLVETLWTSVNSTLPTVDMLHMCERRLTHSPVRMLDASHVSIRYAK